MYIFSIIGGGEQSIKSPESVLSNDTIVVILKAFIKKHII